MNDKTNETKAGDPAEQWSAFQKIWTDTFTRMMQAGMTFSPESTPPEFMRQFRSGIFQALAQSWEEFLRSPQFLEGMKQWMDNAIAFRKMSNDFLTKVRHDGQATAREDIDALLLAVRHLETRVLDRVDDLAHKVDTLNKRFDALSPQAAGDSPPVGPARKPQPKPKEHR